MGRRPKNKTIIKKTRKVKPLQLLRGMKDIIPQEQVYWDYIKERAENIVKDYGFKRIDTPVLESSSLFMRSTGKGTDIVEKEMFSFADDGKDSVSLKPEATPGIARAYIEHGMINLPQPVKLYTISPLFRRERPQAGRVRQHHQLDLEVIGDKNPVIEAQLLVIANNFYKSLGIPINIKINSIGCVECRAQYQEDLIVYLKSKKTKLCVDCKRRITKNPLRILDCKEEKCQEIVSEAPQIVDSLCESCKDHFTKVLEYIDELGIPYEPDVYLVRGLDYYTRTVFEIWPANNDDNYSRQTALGGGGRYDDLIEELGGQETPACGMGLGIERAILKLKENKTEVSKKQDFKIFVAQLGEKARIKAISLFEELREAGIKPAENFSKGSLRSQLDLANKLGVKMTLIIGQKEVMDKTVLIRDMDSGIQEEIVMTKIVKEVKRRLR